MTVRASSDAVQQNSGQESGTTEQMERELAALEALLTRQLQGRQRYDDAEPRLRRTAPVRPRVGTRQEFRDRPVPVPESELSEWMHCAPDLAAPATMPRVHDLAQAAVPQPDRPSRLERVAPVVAAVFGMVALLAVSAMAMLIVSGGPPATVTAGDSAPATPPAEQSILAAQNAPVPPASAQQVEAPARTASHASAVTREGAPQAADGFTGVPHPAEDSTVSTPTAGVPMSGAALPPPTAERDSAIGGPFEPVPVSTPAAAAQQPAPAGSPSADGTAQADVAVIESDDINVASDDVNVEVTEGTAGVPAAQPTRSAAVTIDVNMRASPDNKAAVVAVVPTGRNVEVVNCEHWCEVVYDGQRGFIYRKFVSGAEP